MGYFKVLAITTIFSITASLTVYLNNLYVYYAQVSNDGEVNVEDVNVTPEDYNFFDFNRIYNNMHILLGYTTFIIICYFILNFIKV